jgi:hypothetical protein
LASIQGDKGKPSARVDVLIVNANINKLLNENDSVTSVVKTLTRITRDHREIFMGTKCGVRKPSGREPWLRG